MLVLRLYRHKRPAFSQQCLLCLSEAMTIQATGYPLPLLPKTNYSRWGICRFYFLIWKRWDKPRSCWENTSWINLSGITQSQPNKNRKQYNTELHGGNTNISPRKPINNRKCLGAAETLWIRPPRRSPSWQILPTHTKESYAFVVIGSEEWKLGEQWGIGGGSGSFIWRCTSKNTTS